MTRSDVDGDWNIKIPWTEPIPPGNHEYSIEITLGDGSTDKRSGIISFSDNTPEINLKESESSRNAAEADITRVEESDGRTSDTTEMDTVYFSTSDTYLDAMREQENSRTDDGF
ncbi:hypothetical protein [Veronia nyctiphanis]|nr:hypothetical protein [Veronia nyctiphanis]